MNISGNKRVSYPHLILRSGLQEVFLRLNIKKCSRTPYREKSRENVEQAPSPAL
jgi:hypothetical protein